MAHTFNRDDGTFSSVVVGDIGTITFGDITDSAWTTFSPTITAGTGTFTTVSGAGRYKQIGKTVFIQIVITITTNGTAATTVLVSSALPVAASQDFLLPGRAKVISGKMIQGIKSGSGILIVNYDNSYPGGDGETLVLSGLYETA